MSSAPSLGNFGCHSSGSERNALIRSCNRRIGEVQYRGQWHPGTHEPLVDRVTWDRVQVLLGEKVYRSHELTYAGGLIQCKHCGSTITGELVVKKATGREYVYYRCSQYNAPGHPRVRLNEDKLDRQLLGIFDRMRIGDE